MRIIGQFPVRLRRAMVLGLIVLVAASLASAQDKPAIERMNERVAAWQTAPTDRFVGFELAFPMIEDDAKRLHTSGMLLVTIVTKDPKKDYASNVSIRTGDHAMQLALLGKQTLPYTADTSMTREDNVYNLPLVSSNGDFDCVVALGWPASTIDLGRIPAWPPDVVRATTNPPAATGTSFTTAEFLTREFPGFALQPPRVRVSSGVAQGNLLRQVKPAYPRDALKAHITGVVVLAATIGADGNIQGLKVISGPPMLIQAAIDAVSQWQYKPYLLNGTPTVVETTITVNFQMNG